MSKESARQRVEALKKQRPNRGDIFWRVSGFSFSVTPDAWDGRRTQQTLYEMGNFFRSEREALAFRKKVLEYLRLYSEKVLKVDK